MMSKLNWQEHIAIDPALHHGDPCIRGTRIPVSIIVGSLADGLTPEDIQTAYPQLTLTDVQAALETPSVSGISKTHSRNN